MEIDTIFIVLGVVAACAGFVDSIVGGGGLLQLPALLVMLPSTSVLTLLGTNKLSSFCGTSFAIFQYSRRIRLPWKILVPASFLALLGSLGGARTASVLPAEQIKPIIFVILVIVALYTFVRKDFGKLEKHPIRKKWIWIALTLGAAIIGFYDGFLGPGTGGFFIVLLIWTLGNDFLKATASAKVLNWATNLSALAYFASTGALDYQLGLIMGACNMAGSYLGTSMAMKRGAPFIRWMFLSVVLLILARFAFDLFS